jgi:hypothetical protein
LFLYQLRTTRGKEKYHEIYDEKFFDREISIKNVQQRRQKKGERVYISHVYSIA